MYSQPIDRSHPACLMILVDQSLSMMDSFAGTGQRKSDSLAFAVNRLIRNLVLQCQRGEEVREYFDLGIVGYGNNMVTSAYGGELAGQHLVPINVVADYPVRIASEHLPDNPEVRVDYPVWLEPVAHGGTPMTQAIDVAGSMIVEWANAHMDSFPPIVVNISDGEATDGDPRPIADQLRSIHTSHGELLFFNVNLSEQSARPIEYPNSPVGLPDHYATVLFEMSSELPSDMANRARGMGLEIQERARGFVFNADDAKLSEFLDVGTPVAYGAER